MAGLPTSSRHQVGKSRPAALTTYAYGATTVSTAVSINSTNSSTTVWTKYYFAGAFRIASRTCSDTTCTDPVYYLSDHLGSTSLTTNASGNKIAELRYTAWGEVRYTWGSTPTDYTYTGQYSNVPDFGLMYYNARWYDPGLGRFAQADTIVPLESQGVQAWDRYAGMNNNPVRYNDPSGHDVGCAGKDASDCKKPQTPREPLCKGWACERLKEIMNGAIITFDAIALAVSAGEAALADIIWAGAAITCASGTACPAAMAVAIESDATIANLGGVVENNVGIASFLLTAGVDVLDGNTTIDDQNIFIGRDTIVAGRNAVVGLLPESNLDLAVSLSQMKYDIDRFVGNKPGGSVPVIYVDGPGGGKLPGLHPEFLKQVFFLDWW